MKEKEHIINGRKYIVKFSPEDAQPGAFVTVGPPEGLVDDLGYPEPFATNLHNILYERHLFTYEEISKKGAALGAIQEAVQAEAYRLVEAFAQVHREPVPE